MPLPEFNIFIGFYLKEINLHAIQQTSYLQMYFSIENSLFFNFTQRQGTGFKRSFMMANIFKFVPILVIYFETFEVIYFETTLFTSINKPKGAYTSTLIRQSSKSFANVMLLVFRQSKNSRSKINHSPSLILGNLDKLSFSC